MNNRVNIDISAFSAKNSEGIQSKDITHIQHKISPNRNGMRMSQVQARTKQYGPIRVSKRKQLCRFFGFYGFRFD